MIAGLDAAGPRKIVQPEVLPPCEQELAPLAVYGFSI